MKEITIRKDNVGDSSLLGSFIQYLLNNKIGIDDDTIKSYKVHFVIGSVIKEVNIEEEFDIFSKSTGCLYEVSYLLNFNTTLHIGDKVTYVTSHSKPEHGIVKSFALNGNPFVVYNCNNDWKNYENYTAANTDKSDLVLGWI